LASNISYLRERGRQKFGERLGVGSAFAVLRVLSPLGRRAEANPFVALAAIKQVVVRDGHPRFLKNSQNEAWTVSSRRSASCLISRRNTRRTRI
jgi:hypothetical protein